MASRIVVEPTSIKKRRRHHDYIGGAVLCVCLGLGMQFSWAISFYAYGAFLLGRAGVNSLRKKEIEQ